MTNHPQAAAPTFQPVRLVEVDIALPIPCVDPVDPLTGKTYQRALSLVRAHGHPLGYVTLDLTAGPIAPNLYAQAIWSTLEKPITEYLRVHHLAGIEVLPEAGIGPLNRVEDFSRLTHDLPFVSVIVTTRENPDSLLETLLSIRRVDYANYEIIVVDNAPLTQDSAEVVKRLSAEMPSLRYVHEERKGLSWARNCGLHAARGEITVFTDDDVLVDSRWLTALVEAFTLTGDVGCVTGLILPRELETPAQVWCEEHGGFSKGFVLQIYDLTEHRSSDPLYPFRLSLFGSGANMAFRTSLLRDLGGYNPLLGAGTPTLSGTEFAAFFKVIREGHRIIYQPDAIVYHAHHREFERFRRQFFGYGVGFTAFFTASILQEPRILWELLQKVPAGLKFILSPSSPRHQMKSATYPKGLDFLEIVGMVYGPAAYLLSQYESFRQRRGRMISPRSSWI